MISIWKWFFGRPFPFGNDFFKMIYCHKKWFLAVFCAKKMIYRCEKSFPSSSEMINYTRKWFRRNSKMIFVKWFLGHLLPLLKTWFTLGKKNISFGNGHFQKWVEIIFFKKMLHNLRNLLAKKARFAETLAYGVHALMKEMLWKRRAWTFFHQQNLKEYATYQKPNIRSWQSIAFFNASWNLNGFEATFAQTQFFHSPF